MRSPCRSVRSRTPSARPWRAPCFRWRSSAAIGPQIDGTADVTAGGSHLLAPGSHRRDRVVDVVAERTDRPGHGAVRRAFDVLALAPSVLGERVAVDPA